MVSNYPLGAGRLILYCIIHDLSEYPGEQNDVAVRHPEMVASMTEIFDEGLVFSFEQITYLNSK